MKKLCLIIFLTLTCCSQAGVNLDSSINATETKSSYLIKGYIGVGQLGNANINIIDVTDYANAQLLYSTSSDSYGAFEFEINNNENSLIMIVANGGSYIDPFSYNTVSANDYELKTLFKIKDITSLSEVYITPFSTLFSSFFDCIYHQSSLSADPYLYTKSVFQNVFLTTPATARDIFLNADIEAETDEDLLLTLYNLAFSKMAQDNKAKSGLDLLTVFSEELLDSCTLITKKESKSLNYTFYDESFRSDFLDSLLTLKNNSISDEIASKVSLSSLVEDLRNNNNLIFGFSYYE